MTRTRACVAVLGALIACGRGGWSSPPAIDRLQYDAEYRSWLDERRTVAAEALRIVGVWPLPEGETPFGSDPSLPIALPASAAPPRAGTFRRVAEKISVVPAGLSMRSEDGNPITAPIEVRGALAVGPLRLLVEGVGEGFSGRRFVTVWDQDRVDSRNPPAIETYPVDFRWRVAARFDAFDAPKSIQVADVRGGMQYFTSPGKLVFHVNDQELRLTALTDPGAEKFFLMFKDETNGTSTFGGYRMLHAAEVGNREWTVLDFNLASNPPCAYSPYTLCPLPPRENHLQVAIQAGEKRFPGVEGFKR